MNNVNVAIIISFLAGISTVIGSFLVFFKNACSKKMLSFSLGFSSGVMVAVSMLDLMPNAQRAMQTRVQTLNGGLLSIFIMTVGMLTASVISKMVPRYKFLISADVKGDKVEIIRTSIISITAIVMHNFPEGIATFMAGYKDITLGISVALAISLHNIPEGISIAVPVYYGTGKRSKAILAAFLSGISEPVGAVLTFVFLRPFINDFLLAILFAFITGIMIFISFDELLPTSYKQGYRKISTIGVLLGVIIMSLGLILF